MNAATPSGSTPPGAAASSVSVRSRLIVGGIALGLLLLAFVQNRSIVHDLSWPGVDIQYRELAAAQTLLDEGYGPDSNYVSERVWYNPMAAWMVAAMSRAVAVSPALIVTHSGPYLNLLAPIALFLMVALLFDEYVALAAVAAFTFIIGTEFPFYYSATYSPWFAPENFGQAFLYLSLVAVYYASQPGAGWWWPTVGGVLLGLTFLTHTAPAIVCGAVWSIVAAVDAYRSGSVRRPLGRLAIVLVVAFLLSLPFAVHILVHYHLKIVNPFPSLSPSDLLDLNELPSLMRTLATIPMLVAIIGLAVTLVRTGDRATRVLGAWLGIVGGLLVANVLRLLLRKMGFNISPVVPPFHFFFYLMAALAVGFGLGVREVARLMARRLATRDGQGRERTVGMVAVAITLLTVAVSYPRYRHRIDFTELRDEAVMINTRQAPDLWDWIGSHTDAEDGFLCEDDVSMYVIAPVGRKVVATNRFFSNPYVDWARRDTDRRRMFERLQRADVDGFLELAAVYRVRFVVLSTERSEEWLRASGLRASDMLSLDATQVAAATGFPIAFRNDRFTVIAVPAARETAAVRRVSRRS